MKRKLELTQQVTTDKIEFCVLQVIKQIKYPWKFGYRAYWQNF